MSFTGEYRHTIDAKGRLIVPSRLRDEIEDGHLILSPWMENCIAMWAVALWEERIAQRLIAERNSDENKRSVARNLAAAAYGDRVDSQGRITVPQHLREFAGIDRDCVVIGALDHGEIWNPSRWEDEKAKTADGGLEAMVQQLDF